MIFSSFIKLRAENSYEPLEYFILLKTIVIKNNC